MPVSFLIFHFLRKYFIHFDRPYFFLKPKIKRIIQVLWKIDDGWRQTKLDLITDKASPKSRIYFFMKENEKKMKENFLILFQHENSIFQNSIPSTIFTFIRFISYKNPPWNENFLTINISSDPKKKKISSNDVKNDYQYQCQIQIRQRNFF